MNKEKKQINEKENILEFFFFFRFQSKLKIEWSNIRIILLFCSSSWMLIFRKAFIIKIVSEEIGTKMFLPKYILIFMVYRIFFKYYLFGKICICILLK